MNATELREFAIEEAEKQDAQALTLNKTVTVETVFGTFEVSLWDNAWESDYRVRNVETGEEI